MIFAYMLVAEFQSLSVPFAGFLRVYIYVYVCMCVCVCIYMYTLECCDEILIKMFFWCLMSCKALFLQNIQFSFSNMFFDPHFNYLA